MRNKNNRPAGQVSQPQVSQLAQPLIKEWRHWVPPFKTGLPQKTHPNRNKSTSFPRFAAGLFPFHQKFPQTRILLSHNRNSLPPQRSIITKMGPEEDTSLRDVVTIPPSSTTSNSRLIRVADAVIAQIYPQLSSSSSFVV